MFIIGRLHDGLEENTRNAATDSMLRMAKRKQHGLPVSRRGSRAASSGGRCLDPWWFWTRTRALELKLCAGDRQKLQLPDYCHET